MYVKSTVPVLAATGIPVALLAGTAVALIVMGVILVLLSAGVFARRRRQRTLGWPLQATEATEELSQPRPRPWRRLVAFAASMAVRAPVPVTTALLIHHIGHLVSRRVHRSPSSDTIGRRTWRPPLASPSSTALARPGDRRAPSAIPPPHVAQLTT